MVYKTSFSGRPETRVVDYRTIDPLLVSLLTKCTPHKTEHHIHPIIEDFLQRLPHKDELKFEILDGNVLVTVGTPKTLYSCHMDIVGHNHKNNEDKGLVDSISLMTPTAKTKGGEGYIYGAKSILDLKGNHDKYEPSTLGADDKVGVYINLKMIEKNISGLYVFHVGEECGGIGSTFLVTNHKEKFEGLQRAIAFDRAGYGDVIEFQRPGRCCSPAFGKALAELLNETMPEFEKFKANVHGSFTDTANYRELIGECTNISVGYFSQHGIFECLDYVWLKHILLPTILNANFDSLPTKRDPKLMEHQQSYHVPYTYTPNTTTYGNSWNRTTWATANKDTKDWDLPLWIPKDGLVVKAKDDVLKRAIVRYCTLLYTPAEKALTGESYYDLLLEKSLLEEENKELNIRLGLLTNKKNTGKVEDITIRRKKELLRSLIEIVEQISLKQSNTLVQAYAKGGKIFLENTKANLIPAQFSKKELRKLNRMIMVMAYYLSIEDYDFKVNPSNETEVIAFMYNYDNLLNEVHEFITLHIHEEGFNMPVTNKINSKVLERNANIEEELEIEQKRVNTVH